MTFRARTSYLNLSKKKKVAASIAMLLTVPGLVQAQSLQVEKEPYQLDIPAASLGSALTRLGDVTGAKLLVASDLINGLETSGIQGRYSLEAALRQLLYGSGLVFSVNTLGGSSDKTIIITPSASDLMTLQPVRIQGEVVGQFGDAPTEPGGLKAEYQTTATKMALSLKETPQAVSVVTRDSMDARQVNDLSTAVELTAGVSNSSNGDGIQSGPGMFGGQGQYDQKFVMRSLPVDIRSDGFKVGNGNADLAAYERIEVIKGPSGFYGQGSLGGFINMVRKKPQAEFAASVSTQAGSFNHYRSEADVTGALNDAKSIRGRMSFAYENAGSFVEDISNSRIMIAPSIEAVLSEKTRILAQVLYQKDSFDANYGIPMEIVGDRMQPYENFSSRTELYGTAGDKSKTEIVELVVKVEHELSDRWLASLLLQSNKSTRDIIEGNGASVYNYGSGYQLYTIGTKDLWERDFWAGELRLQGRFDAFGQEHELLMGVEHNDQHATRDFGYIFKNIGTPETFSGDFSNYQFLSIKDLPTTITRDRNIDNSGLFVQTVLTLQEKTKLLISGRYDKADDHLVGVASGGPFESGPRGDEAFTSRLGLTHAFTNNISAYGTFAESFQPIGSSADPEKGGGILDPIMGEGYELGLKTDWFNNQLGATLAVYQQDLDNRPIADPDSRDYSISAGLHRTKGVELELTGAPYPGLTIAAAAGWMDNEFLDDDDPNKGLSIDGSVDKQFSFYANYEWQTGPLKGFSAGASFVRIGDRHFVIADKQALVDGYNRTDLNFSYRGLTHWDMSLLIRNVTDVEYIETATKLAEGNYYGSPRAGLLNVTYHF